MAKVVFYCRGELSSIDKFEYYRQDLDALRALGHEVVVCVRYRQIPKYFDLMFVWWWTYALYPVALARALGRPALVTGTYNFKFPPDFGGVDFFARPGWQRAPIALATKYATLNLFVNKREMKACSDYFGLRNERYYPHVVADDYLLGPSEKRSLAIFNLAWSGRMNLERKGVFVLIEAIQMLHGEFPDLRVNLAGHEGDGAGYLRQQIEERNLTSVVQHLGSISREEKLRLLRETELYVQPSRYEGFGVAIAEAMGSGAYVITCDVGGVADVVGDSGVYVKPGSPGELAAAIRVAMTDHQRRRDLQHRAHERAKKQFKFSSKVDRLREYLAEVGIR